MQYSRSKKNAHNMVTMEEVFDDDQQQPFLQTCTPTNLGF